MWWKETGNIYQDPRESYDLLYFRAS